MVCVCVGGGLKASWRCMNWLHFCNRTFFVKTISLNSREMFFFFWLLSGTHHTHTHTQLSIGVCVNMDFHVTLSHVTVTINVFLWAVLMHSSTLFLIVMFKGHGGWTVLRWASYSGQLNGSQPLNSQHPVRSSFLSPDSLRILTRFSAVAWQTSTSASDTGLVWRSSGATVCCPWPSSLARHPCHTFPHCYYERWNVLLLRLYNQRHRRHRPRWRAAPKCTVIVLGSFRPGSTGGSFGQLAAFFLFFLSCPSSCSQPRHIMWIWFASFYLWHERR